MRESKAGVFFCWCITSYWNILINDSFRAKWAGFFQRVDKIKSETADAERDQEVKQKQIEVSQSAIQKLTDKIRELEADSK